MNNTIYLLTGAAGFLGSNISRALVERGNCVRALVLPNDPAAQHIPSEVEIITGDLLDKEAMEKFFAIDGHSDIVVIHCASMVTVSPEFSQKLYDVNVNGTKNILEKCIQRKVKKLVYVSSTGAIPELPHGQVIREVKHFRPDAVVGAYGHTKAEATQLVLNACAETELDASIVFPSGICGPNDYAYGYYSNFIMDVVKGKMPAGIAGSFNAADVRDLANGVIACAEKGRKGEGYILANDTVTIEDIFALITRYTAAKKITTILPVSIANIVAHFAEIYGKITGKPVALTTFAVYNLARNNNYSSAKAKHELGYKVRTFEESIRDTITWLASEGKIEIKEQPAAAKIGNWNISHHKLGLSGKKAPKREVS